MRTPNPLRRSYRLSAQDVKDRIGDLHSFIATSWISMKLAEGTVRFTLQTRIAHLR
jgi:hypothetical protein